MPGYVPSKQTPCLPSDEPGSKISCDRILSDEEKQGFVDRHNHWRNQAALGTFNPKTKASQMPRVFWDSELAEHSKNYSRLCVWQHSGPYGFNNLDYGYGENLYASTVNGKTTILLITLVARFAATTHRSSGRPAFGSAAV